MKKVLLGMFAVAVAVCGVAFTKANDSKLMKDAENKLAPQWFYYVGTVSPATQIEAKKSANYRTLTATEVITALCPGSVSLCAIQAENDGTGHPAITGQPIETSITNYFANPALPPAVVKEKN